MALKAIRRSAKGTGPCAASCIAWSLTWVGSDASSPRLSGPPISHARAAQGGGERPDLGRVELGVAAVPAQEEEATATGHPIPTPRHPLEVV